DQSIVGSVNFGSRTNPDSGVNFSDHLHPIGESNFIKRVTLTYQPADGVNLYATYSEGFSAGGYNRTGGVAGFNGFVVPANYNTETTKNYELGWKLLLDDRRLRLNTALYRMDWDNIVVGIFDPSIVNATFFANAGKARIYGLEPQLSYLLTKNWSIDAALTFVHARLVAVPSTVPDIVPVGSQ